MYTGTSPKRMQNTSIVCVVFIVHLTIVFTDLFYIVHLLYCTFVIESYCAFLNVFMGVCHAGTSPIRVWSRNGTAEYKQEQQLSCILKCSHVYYVALHGSGSMGTQCCNVLCVLLLCKPASLCITNFFNLSDLFSCFTSFKMKQKSNKMNPFSSSADVVSCVKDCPLKLCVAVSFLQRQRSSHGHTTHFPCSSRPQDAI